MIVPSIDLMGGRTVQLIGGREHALDAGDPSPLARRFGVVGEVAVIDLDAAMGGGSNAGLVRAVLPLARCRVGGGIRDVGRAIEWLDAGASKVILGTAARPEVLRELPRQRVIAAVDARDGEVVVEGWRSGTGEALLARVERLAEHVGGFLVTFVEREGRLGGTRLDLVEQIVRAAAGARVTIAGGVTTPEEIRALDAMGADAQVGMALYTGRLELGDAVGAVLRSDRGDGLWPTVVVDERGVALGLCYSSAESLREAVRSGRGVYHSRTRGVWVKGESSGQTQELLRVDVDCDRDALRFMVRQGGGGGGGGGGGREGRGVFCHTGTRTCWGADGGLGALEGRIGAMAGVPDAPGGSYTKRLLGDAALLRAKLVEEAGELAAAVGAGEVAHEAADLVYFAMVAMARAGVRWEDVERVLDARGLRVTRRAGDAKPGAIAGMGREG